MWDEITCPFPNFNGATVEVWEWTSNFIPHFTGNVICYPCLRLKLIQVIKGVPGVEARLYQLTWGSMTTSCVTSVQRNYRKLKYIVVLPPKKNSLKELTPNAFPQTHFSDFICMPWHLKPLATWLTVQLLALTQVKGKIKAHFYWPFERGICLLPLQSPYIGPEMWKHFHVINLKYIEISASGSY